jgi:hypothetical protein
MTGSISRHIIIRLDWDKAPVGIQAGSSSSWAYISEACISKQEQSLGSIPQDILLCSRYCIPAGTDCTNLSKNIVQTRKASPFTSVTSKSTIT